MTRRELYRRIMDGPLILDGATGSNLQKAGMPVGVCPELWILDHPDVILKLQRDFVEAGTQILYAPTFSANRVKLSEYGAGERIREINTELVKLSRKAAAGRALVAGDLTMTGTALAPIGPMDHEELIDIYKEQASYLLEAGADLFVVETMMSLAETRACLIAIREICDLPVITSLTFQEDGRTLYGTDPVTAVVVLQSLGADVVGVNCSTGPAEMIPVIEKMRDYAKVPLLAKPNAGLPVLVEGRTVYPMEAEEFASYGPAFVEAGASLLGGCCGSTPEHIRMLSRAVAGCKTRMPKNLHPSMLASERRSQELKADGPFLVIGERINPTGKKDLQAELRQGRLDMVEEFASQQEAMGAHILDVNMGMNGIDEKEMMLNAIDRITMITDLPLCIDTSHVDVMEAALRRYPGRALINSISLEKEKMDKLLPLARKYGAMFILLPLSDKGLPESLEEKKEIIRTITDRAGMLGIGKEDIIVDGLVTTVGANKRAALETLDTISWCRYSLGLLTTVGLSNISFGLPQRPYVNGAFASMAIASGLTMAIANPSNALFMGISYAADLLRNKEGADITYIDLVSRMGPVPGTEPPVAVTDKSVNVNKEEGTLNKEEKKIVDDSVSQIYEAVLKGRDAKILQFVEQALIEGYKPGTILDECLIPAINEVGRLFDQQRYFLPQLISSANTMEKAVRHLEPLMEAAGQKEERASIVIATVEGDIHDIGKNLVALMLRNYGYHVIDLGKDVPADSIIGAAKEHRASIIVLSALMTTTMMRMKDTVTLRNEQLPGTLIMIGGAVTTPEFADEIGADAYSKDAADAVRVAGILLKDRD